METKYGVLTPAEIVDALRYDGGIRNKFVDYIRVNRTFKSIMEYECAEKAKLISNLESPAEIRYEEATGGTYILKCFKYSHAFYRIFSVVRNESIEIIEDKHHLEVDKERYATEEERIAEKEKVAAELEMRANERLALSANGSVPSSTELSNKKKKRKKRRTLNREHRTRRNRKH